VRDTLLPAISHRLHARTGFRTFFYGNFRDPIDPTQGWETYPGLPRFGSHYRGLTGRMDILLEAYSYLTFRERCAVMQATLEEILTFANEHGRELVEIVAAAETETVRRGHDPDPGDFLGVSYAAVRRRAPDETAAVASPAETARAESLTVDLSYPIHPLPDPVEILAWDADSLAQHRVPGKTLTPYRALHYARFVPTQVVSRPFAYLLPASSARIAHHLVRHNLDVQVVGALIELEVEVFVIDGIARTASADIADEAPPETLFFGHRERAQHAARPGDFLVPMAQPFANLAVYLLEPESDDGLVEWGFFPELAPGDVYPVRRILRPFSVPSTPLAPATAESAAG
jgi:hypothetical protein